MRPKNSKTNKDSKYIKESIIEGHGNPIEVERLIELIENAKNAMFRIFFSTKYTNNKI